MTQEKLSNLFNRNYNNLLDYSSKASRVLTHKPASTQILSECYLYLDDKRHQLNTEEDVVSWGKTWIKNNLKWSSSPYKKLERIRPNHCEFEDWGSSSYDMIDGEAIQKLMSDFESTLNTIDKRLFSIYIVKEIRKGKDVAEHLDISISGAYGIINQCKEIEGKFKDWLKNQI